MDNLVDLGHFRRLAFVASGECCLMRCYCGQSQPGIWDQRGIAHSTAVCRYTDRYIATRWAYQAVPKARSQR